MTLPRRVFARDRFTIVVGDITRLAVDAIVNAANPQMLGGGGVDGAIHRAAGPALLRECREIAQSRPGVRCPTGEARITDAYELVNVRHIIHTVGPVHAQHEPTEAAALLSSCYHQSLQLAHEHGLDRIAFPCISTGLFGYPRRAAAKVALNATRAWLESRATPRQEPPRQETTPQENTPQENTATELRRKESAWNRPREIIFSCFTNEDAEHYVHLLGSL